MDEAGVVVVYGATGHTGRFVVAELLRRGFAVVASGRSAEQLERLAPLRGDLEVRRGSVGDAGSLDRMLAGAVLVVNCAGPFAVTGRPVVEAALRAGIPYVDVSAEIEANASTFADHARAARDAGIAVVPAMAFYGGLGDLLATAALGDWTAADEVCIAYGLTSWHPTPGTRAAGRVSHDRRGGRRVRFTGGALEYHDSAPLEREWSFPEPMGRRQVLTGFTMTDVVTIPSHLAVAEVTTCMAVQAAQDLADGSTPPPEAVDALGRSDQTFVVEVVVRSAGLERRATAAGQDIYAVTAPLVGEAVQRILSGRTRTTGVASAGAMFDAADFLRCLAPHITVELPCS